MAQQTSLGARVVRVSLHLAALVGLVSAGACVSIPQRAWANGEAMTASHAYRAVLSGDKSFRAHRELENSLNPRLLNYREVQFAPFGRWW